MAQAHHIGRIRFEIASRREGDLLGLRQKLETAAQNRFQDALARSLDRVSAADEVLRIDRLEIDLGTLAPGADPDLDAIADAVALAVSGARRAGVDGPPASGWTDPERRSEVRATRQSVSEARLEALLRYLETGALPAFAPDRDIAVLVGHLLAEQLAPSALHTLMEQAHRRAASARRLAFVLSVASARTLIESARSVVSPRSLAALSTLADKIVSTYGAGPHALTDRTEVLRQLAALALSDAEQEAGGGETKAKATAMDEAPTQSKPAAPQETEAEGDPAEPGPVPLENAGLVLLWPFLPHLFENLSLDPQGNDATAAAQVLHHLATGRAMAQEPELLIARVLLNIPPETPLLPTGDLPDDTLRECGALLDAVIGHWNKLGRTSPDALRETFLRRPGLHDAGRARILVEKRGVDALLASIPWSLDKIMLPWLDRPIVVVWE